MKKTHAGFVSMMKSVVASGAAVSMALAGLAPLGALAAPPVLVSGYTSNTTSGSSLTLTKPSGVQAGDLLVLLVGNDDSTGTAQWDNSIYKPAGFTLVNEAGTADSDCHVAAFVRLADGNEGATINVPAQSADDYWGFYARVTGADTGLPISAIGTDASIGSSKTLAINGVTVPSAESLAFYASCYDGADGNPFSISGAGWTESAEAQTSGGGNGAGGAWGTRTLSAPGASGTATVGSNIKDGFSGFQFAVAAVVTPPSSVFGSPTAYGVGSAPSAVATGDFNHDSSTDIALVASGGLSILLNNGSGGYGSPATYATNASPLALAVADVDNDSHADIVTTAASGSVSVHRNNGDGTFAAKTDYTVGSAAYGVALANMNGDTYADIVVSNYSPGTVSVLLNNGDGTFGAAASYTAGAGAFGVSAVDLNSDAFADIIVANYTASTVSVLLNNGNGTFGATTNYSVGTLPRDVAVADVNGDNAPDIASANFYRVDGVGFGDSTSILMNNGNGTYAPAVLYAMGDAPADVALADVNGDNAADVLTADFDGHTVTVRLNNGDGTFGQKTAYTTGYQPVSLAVADVNGDLAADAITADSAFGEISVLLNTN